jgi:hypothetical protein
MRQKSVLVRGEDGHLKQRVILTEAAVRPERP